MNCTCWWWRAFICAVCCCSNSLKALCKSHKVCVEHNFAQCDSQSCWSVVSDKLWSLQQTTLIWHSLLGLNTSPVAFYNAKSLLVLKYTLKNGAAVCKWPFLGCPWRIHRSSSELIYLHYYSFICNSPNKILPYLFSNCMKKNALNLV